MPRAPEIGRRWKKPRTLPTAGTPWSDASSPLPSSRKNTALTANTTANSPLRRWNRRKLAKVSVIASKAIRLASTGT